MNKIIKRLRKTASNNLKDYKEVSNWINESIEKIERQVDSLFDGGFSKIPLYGIIQSIDNIIDYNDSLSEEDREFLLEQKKIFKDLDEERKSCSDLYSQLNYLKKCMSFLKQL